MQFIIETFAENHPLSETGTPPYNAPFINQTYPYEE